MGAIVLDDELRLFLRGKRGRRQSSEQCKRRDEKKYQHSESSLQFRISLSFSRFFLNPPDFLEPLPDARLKSLIGWLVICTSQQAFRQARHVRDFLIDVVRVLVAFSVTDTAH